MPQFYGMRMGPLYYSPMSSIEVHINSQNIHRNIYIHTFTKLMRRNGGTLAIPWGVDKGVHCSKQIYCDPTQTKM